MGPQRHDEVVEPRPGVVGSDDDGGVGPVVVFGVVTVVVGALLPTEALALVHFSTSVCFVGWLLNVPGNERADRLASTADITSGLQLGRAEVLRGLRNFLNTDKPEHHSIDRLKERGVEKGSGRHSTLQGRQRSMFNQANIGTVSRATLGRLLRDEAERVWAFPSATMPS